MIGSDYMIYGSDFPADNNDSVCLNLKQKQQAEKEKIAQKMLK